MEKYPFTIELLSPMVHGDFNDGQDTGNFKGFRHQPRIGRDGEIHRVPVISGNAIRGKMRRLLSQEYFDRTGLKDDKLYIAMANGGAIGKKLDTYIRPELIEAHKKTFPVISAFGSALYTYMLPGVVNIAFAVPRCAELGTGGIGCRDLLADISQARHIDRTKARYEFEDGLKITPMPFTVEALISGTMLDSSLTFLDPASDMDKAVVFHGLKLLSSLGGQGASGYGDVAIATESEMDDSLYVEWLASLPEDYNQKALELAGAW